MKIAKKSLPKSISLDRYLLFFHSRPCVDLTVPELKQIVFLHGFKKDERNPKKVLTEALEDLDLMDLSRSTIQERSSEISSSSASITLEELVDDLNKLDWQECCITSVEALYSQKEVNGSTSTHQAFTDLSFTQPDPDDTFPQSVSAFKKRKTASVQTLLSTKDDAAPTSHAATEPAKLKNQPTAAFNKSKTASVSPSWD
ncbi:hypothetical protein LINGRAHAP2_LOCUS20114 [Linum grandiflorum]